MRVAALMQVVRELVVKELADQGNSVVQILNQRINALLVEVVHVL